MSNEEQEMSLTGELIEEHRLIKRMIGALEEVIEKLKVGDSVAPEVFEDAVDFIRNFADGFHHAKEEDILFKELMKKGMPEKDGPVDVMLIEHEQGRDFVRGIVESIGPMRNHERGAVGKIMKNTQGYVELLREHIEKEDNILYPLAERAFTEKEKERQKKKFQEANLRKGGKETVAKYRKIVLRLEKHYGGRQNAGN